MSDLTENVKTIARFHRMHAETNYGTGPIALELHRRHTRWAEQLEAAAKALQELTDAAVTWRLARQHWCDAMDSRSPDQLDAASKDIEAATARVDEVLAEVRGGR